MPYPTSAAASTGRSSLSPAIALRIQFLRISLVAGIVVLHTPPTWPLEDLPGTAFHWPGVIKLFFDYGPLRAGVPVLSLISGYLLFLLPYRSHATLVRRKLTTLLLPFILWNAVVIALHGIRHQNDVASLLDIGAGPAAWLAAVSAFLDGPPDYPTYFLIDLLIMALLSPIVGALLRRAPVTTLAAGSLAAAIGYGPIPTVRSDIALPFIFGAAGAVCRIDPRFIDRYAWPLLFGFMTLSVVFVASLALELNTPLSLGVLRAAGVPALWAVSAELAPTAAGRWLAGLSGFAFILFCAHSPALHLLWSVWPEWAGYWWFYSLAAPSVIVVILLVTAGLKRWCGRLLELLTGARVGRGAVQERKS